MPFCDVCNNKIIQSWIWMLSRSCHRFTAVLHIQLVTHKEYCWQGGWCTKCEEYPKELSWNLSSVSRREGWQIKSQWYLSSTIKRLQVLQSTQLGHERPRTHSVGIEITLEHKGKLFAAWPDLILRSAVLWATGWTRWSSKVPADPCFSMVLSTAQQLKVSILCSSSKCWSLWIVKPRRRILLDTSFHQQIQSPFCDTCENCMSKNYRYARASLSCYVK